MGTPEMPLHHLGDDDLLDYAAGRFAEPFAVLIAAHLTLCPACRRTVAGFEALGGDAIEAVPSIEMSAGSLDAMLARLDAPATIERALPTPPATGELRHLPAPLRAFVGAAPRWKKGMRGFEAFEIGAGRDGVRARLMRIASGCAMPRHTHGGREMLIVLDGGYQDEIGVYDVGDVAVADSGVVHRPVADAAEGCLCFAVTDAPLKLTGPIGRVLNLFIRY
jgi:putative transcriptional regulator